jgi:hypothetical protein
MVDDDALRPGITFRGNQAYIANLSFGAAGGKLSILGTPSSGLAVP